MASSAQQTNGFVDPFNFEFPGDTSKGALITDNDFFGHWGTSGIPGGLAKLLGFDVDKAYNEKMTKLNQEYERQSINSARAWSEYMDNTKVQRNVEDIKKAGLNPWLAIQNGLGGSGSAPSVDTGGSAQHQTASNQSKTGLATLLMAIAKILA